MAKLPQTMIALPVRWETAQVLVVSDNVDVNRNVIAVNAGTWTRLFLAPNAGGGSEAGPRDLLRLVQGALNASGGLWLVSLAETGFVRVTYNGLGTGTISFASALNLRNALGFSSDISLDSGSFIDGQYLPAHCWYPYSLDSDTGFRAEHSIAAAARQSNGQVVAFDEGYQSIDRSFKARFAPATESVRIAKGWSAHAYWPHESETVRWTKPSLSTNSVPLGWTVHETLSCALGRRVAYVFERLQELISGASSRYCVGAFDPDALRSKSERAVLTIPAYSSLIDVPQQTLTLTTTEER